MATQCTAPPPPDTPPGRFEHHRARVNGVELHFVCAGTGPALYLLHGYPQSWYIWRRVAPRLSQRFRIVMPDLRGYGDSEKPPGGYDKRTMAADVAALARHLGHRRLGLVGHDRGGRVAHRFALDHEGSLSALMLLDIEPTLWMFDHFDRESALAAWHWVFLPVPELAPQLIEARPEAFLRHLLAAWSGREGAIEEAAVREYLRTFARPDTIAATCADYRAGATVDLDHDRADRDRRVEVPLRVLWGGLGRRARRDVVAIWREHASDVSGCPLPDCGHFIPEEAPDALCAEIDAFFAEI